MSVKHILVPYDQSKISRKAVLKALDIAKIKKAKLTILYVHDEFAPLVIGTYSMGPLIAKQITGLLTIKNLKKFEKMAKDSDIEAESIVIPMVHPGNNPLTISEAIVEYVVHNGVHMIVMGTRGLRGWKKVLFGSITEEVKTRNPPCKILTVT